MTKIKYWRVGGCVRDAILGVRSKDIDYAVEAPSYEAMVQDIKDKGGLIFLETPKYLTVRAKMNGEASDYVLCRKDGAYYDNRHPESVEPGTILDDLSRRDFTMNAIAQDSDTGWYYDPFHGLDDINNKLIRCVGKTEDRFNEDALRMLRALRFSITKGFSLHDDIVDCLEYDVKLVDKIGTISTDRVREELRKCFAFDTKRTILLLNHYFMLSPAIFNNHNIWLEPTSKDP